MTSKMIEWEDATSYSRGERGKVEPKSWSCEVFGVTLWLSKEHIYYPDTWVMRFGGLLNEPRKVAATTEMSVEQAQNHAFKWALRLARAEAGKWAAVVSEMESSQ